MGEIGPAAAAGALLQIPFAGDRGLEPDTAGAAGLPQDFLTALARALYSGGETVKGGQAGGVCLCAVPAVPPTGEVIADAAGAGEALSLTVSGVPLAREVFSALLTTTGVAGEGRDQAAPASGAGAPDAEPDTPSTTAVAHPAPTLPGDAAFYALLQVAALWPPLHRDATNPLDGQLLDASAATEAPASGPRLVHPLTASRAERLAPEAGCRAAGMPATAGQDGTPAADEIRLSGIPAPAERAGGHAPGHDGRTSLPVLDGHPAALPDPLLPAGEGPAQLPRLDEAHAGPPSNAPEQHVARAEMPAVAPEAHPQPGSGQLAAPPSAHGWDVSPWVPGAPAEPARMDRRLDNDVAHLPEAVERPPQLRPSEPRDVSAQPGERSTQPPDRHVASPEPAGPAPGGPAAVREVPHPSVAGPARQTEARLSIPARHSGEPGGAGRHEAAAAMVEATPGPAPAGVARPAAGQATNGHSPAGGEAGSNLGRSTEQAGPARSRIQQDGNDFQAVLPALAPAQPQAEPGSRAVPPQSLVMQVLSRAHLLASPTGRVVRFRLEPEQLGELEVRLVLRPHGGLDLRIAAPADDVGRALAAAWPELREALAARGLQAERLLVTVHNGELSLSTSGGSSHPSPGHGRPFEPPAAAPDGPRGSRTAPPEAGPAGAASPDRASAGRLDYRV